MTDGYFLVFTPSSIPSSSTQGPNANLSLDEGFEEVLEDSEDKPTMKTWVSNFDKDSEGDKQ